MKKIIAFLIAGMVLFSGVAFAELTADDETGLKKLLALEVARAQLDAKKEARRAAMQAAQAAVENTYNTDIVALEASVETAKTDLGK